MTFQLKPCRWCNEKPSSIKLDGLVFVVFGCCDEFEIPAAANYRQAAHIWNNGDKKLGEGKTIKAKKWQQELFDE